MISVLFEQYNGIKREEFIPSSLPIPTTEQARLSFPLLLKAWSYIEFTSGFRWKATSYVRDSPSHKKGTALDLAPVISPDSVSEYALATRSDPVLNRRPSLLRAVSRAGHLIAKDIHSSFLPVYFVENTHLHINVYQIPDKYRGRSFIFFTRPAPLPDSLQREQKIVLGPNHSISI